MKNLRARLRRFTRVTIALTVVGLISTAAPVNAESKDARRPYRVVVGGLDNPRGLDVGPRGTLILSEAGRGGTDCTEAVDPETGEPTTLCLGRTGSIKLVVRGHTLKLASLPSIASPEGSDAGGSTNTSWSPVGGLDVIMNGNTITDFQGSTGAFGKLLNLSFYSGLSRRANISKFEQDNNPAGGEIDSNPYGTVSNGRYTAVADAGGNDLLKVDRRGNVSLLAVFPQVIVPWPAGLPFGPPPGTPTPADSVPTSVTVGPDGAFYVGELTGFPFVKGAARVWRVVPGKAPRVYAKGFTNIIDLQFDSRGRLHVLELSKDGLTSGNPNGALIRVGRQGGKTLIASAGLPAPGGLAIDRHDRIFVTVNSTSAGIGKVLRIS